ncbi:amidohydrolase family protein [Actinomyces slackii]|uniref:Imidazolonepropionase n=2 Tax=Actinomyces slackii TaxID=52774 RepID=A0A3S4SDU6_9ACTO|nr:imidazolonepropionase [Actinomyces slackii]
MPSQTPPAPSEDSTWVTPPRRGAERVTGAGPAIITAERILTGRRGDAAGTLEVLADPVHGVGVLLDGPRITAVGPLPELQDQAGAALERLERLDLPGATLMPGLIETHAHLATSGTDIEYPEYGVHEVARLTLNAVRAIRELASVGITSVQSLGARHYVDVALRDAIDDGSLRGPRLRASGPQITTTGGHSWHAGAEVDGLDDIRRAVRDHHKRGVDTVKFMATGGFTTAASLPWNAQFTAEEMALIVAETHRLGHLSAAHAHGTQGIERAVDAGIDYLAHASFISASGRTEFDPALADRIAEAGIYVDCTITADVPGMIERNPDFAPPARQLWERGVRIVAGHDTGIPQVAHRSYVAGLQALEEVGLPRAEVILAATSRAAAAIGLAGITGALAPGYEADIIAVASDPTEGLGALHTLRAVIMRGREFVPDPVQGLPRIDDPDPAADPAIVLAAHRDSIRRINEHPNV